MTDNPNNQGEMKMTPEQKEAFRREVLEEAAKVADDHTPKKFLGTLAAHIIGTTIAREIRALAANQPAPAAFDPKCLECKGTGIRDSGGTHPWGEPAMVPCDCDQPAADTGQAVALTYTNWRGETSERTIVPLSIWYGSTDWHPEPQWLIKAMDVAKGAERDFALKDFGHTTPLDAERIGKVLLDLADWVEDECGAELPHDHIAETVAALRYAKQEDGQ